MLWILTTLVSNISIFTDVCAYMLASLSVAQLVAACFCGAVAFAYHHHLGLSQGGMAAGLTGSGGSQPTLRLDSCECALGVKGQLTRHYTMPANFR